MRFSAFFLFAAVLLAQTFGSHAAHAQTITLTGPQNVKPGQTGVVLSVNLSGSAGANIAALQATLSIPAGFTITSSSIGASGTSAGKTLFCNPTAPTCILAGLNQTVLADGVLFTVTGTVAASASGSLGFSLSNQLGASNAAKAVSVPIATGPALSLPVISPCDINGDGKVDISDVQAYLNSYILTATPANPIVDLNGDGIANIIDVQRIATAGTPGGACVTGP